MERAMTADEKIRRAEEIYQRRRMNETRKTTARVNVADTPNDYKLFKKMILQIMICLCIYFIFFLIKNSNYIFSENFIEKAKEILSYDINFEEQYKNISSFIEQNINNKETEQENRRRNNTTIRRGRKYRGANTKHRRSDRAERNQLILLLIHFQQQKN